jgi:uncharacterized membrane protein
MSENERRRGRLIAVGAVLGVGIGAAVGSFLDDLSTGIWIGAVLGVGLGMLGDYFAN